MFDIHRINNWHTICVGLHMHSKWIKWIIKFAGAVCVKVWSKCIHAKSRNLGFVLCH